MEALERTVPRGRATGTNPPNRFERLHLEPDPSSDFEARAVQTEFFFDRSKSALSANDSPDVGFRFSTNPYRGCEHGCIYCYARPSHEYLGFSAGLDFETKILVKEDLPDLLAAAFERESWVPQPVILSGNTDCYQPAERRLGITRRVLEVMLRYRNPVAVITKNRLIMRDVDLLSELARQNLVHVTVSLTTLRPDLVQVMEPRTARPALRLKTIRELTDAGIPVGVNVAPILPGLTDDEMPAILRAAADNGALSAHYQILRLAGPVKDLFLEWVKTHYPNRYNRVVGRLESLFGENLTRTEFGLRMKGEGNWANLLETLFNTTCRKVGLSRERRPLDTSRFRRINHGQLRLF